MAGYIIRQEGVAVASNVDIEMRWVDAWNEVVLNGVWVPVDASLNQVELDAGHISFGADRAAFGTMLQSWGKLSFKVIEVQSSK